VMHGGKVVRCFSARDYEGHQNDACVISLRRRNPYGGTILVRPQVLRSITKSKRSQTTANLSSGGRSCGPACGGVSETESSESDSGAVRLSDGSGD
jgi:hypothetical protein